MTLYHLNPEKGPRPCSAAEGCCPFGKTAPHFRSFDEAQTVFEHSLKLQHGELSTKRRRSRSGVETLDFDEMVRKMESSQSDFNRVVNDLDRRLRETERFFKKMEKIDPYNLNAERPVSKSAFKVVQKGVDEYRNVTASRIEAIVNCSRWSTSVKTWPKDERIGLAIPVTSYPQNDPRWYTSRMDTLGGSDIGALAVFDFTPEDKLTSFAKFKLNSVEKGKIEGVKAPKVSDGPIMRRGAAYRGTAWESWLTDEYARQNPDLIVYSSSGQYAHSVQDWTRANFDALTSDRKDGVPTGILEIKTGSDLSKWKDGLPLDYRAQTLFYLHVTGLRHAVVRAKLNDTETKDYHLSKDDEVAPGSNMTMSEYLEERVVDWFNDLKSRRGDAA